MTNDEATIDVVLRDGSTVGLRRADEQDVDALFQFLGSLSPQSLYYRFLGHLSVSATRVLDLTVAKGCAALVAESGGRVVAFAGFYRDPVSADRAEVAFAVSDAMQGHGLGTRLLERLADIARDEGIRAFDAYVLGENRRMLDVFRDSGFCAHDRRRRRGVSCRHLAVGHRALRGKGGRSVTNRGDGVDEGVLRASGDRRHRRQSRARQDRL